MSAKASMIYAVEMTSSQVSSHFGDIEPSQMCMIGLCPASVAILDLKHLVSCYP